MSIDDTDDLHAAEEFAGDAGNAARELADAIDAIDAIGQPRELLIRIRADLRRLDLTWRLYCRPTCRFVDEGECQSDDPDTCGCPCSHTPPRLPIEEND